MTETPEERLERLREATAGIRARPGFVARVMGRVTAEPTWIELLPLVARRLWPVAALTVAVALLLAYWSDERASEALAWSDDVVENEW